ncbi:STAS domain-containing protein [Pseudoduganella sp. FT25W]|jgi:rsbT co-antagonist protein RsbR|uniref:STAS domain-containing protein n=1 Tax=Duganella alba TaxID=2666081 RepID=A0A6L5QI46_9BURK|nr:STAS domain-containing protein [Duganella alba]MRX08631.1 STAS domain-containing protein [Duganella alba]MRX18193.1 STAS domain-containing protein [Duganella alba]
MSANNIAQRLSTLITQHESSILAAWTAELGSKTFRSDEASVQRHTRQFLALLPAAIATGGTDDINHRNWDEVRNLLNEISAQRAKQGSTPNETATFVFSLKQPLFTLLRTELAAEPGVMAEVSWAVSTLLDQLGLYTVEVFQKSRDQIIVRQQHELMELSTPVVKLWQDILALPLIGTLDSARSQVVMESLLEKVVETGAAIAIIDITGVPTVDTLVAQHLMKTIAAARLMGADCIISGIRPQIAQTIVHLGVNLEDVITKATLADAFVVALDRVGATISRKG